jgi:hypothetical protein
MKRKNYALFLACAALAFLAIGCATSSKIVTGQARAPIAPDAVKVYSTSPAEFQEIAIVRGKGYSDEGALNAAKKQAAKLGANGLIIKSVHGNAWGWNEMNTVDCSAIFVPAEKPLTPSPSP